MSKKIIGLIAIVAGLLMLSGCGGGVASDDESNVISNGRGYSVISVDVGSKTIPCVFYGRGGVDCDWSK